MKKIMLVSALGLLLTACGGPGTSNQVTSVSGTVVELVPPAATASEYTLTTKAWTGGAGTVNGQVSDGGRVKLGDLAASGAFTATLPTPAATDLGSTVATGLGTGCTGQFNVSDPAARLTTLNVSVDVSDLSKDGTVAPLTARGQRNIDAAGTGTASAEVQVGMLIYADRAVSITGTQNCTNTLDASPTAVTAALNLAQGWNTATVKFSTAQQYINNAISSSTATMSINSGNFPSSTWAWLGDGIGLLGAKQVTPAALLKKAQLLLR